MKIRWNPRIRSIIISDDSAILLSETETLSLNGTEYKHVIDRIQTGHSIYDLTHLGLHENARVLQIVESLTQQNLIEQAKTEPTGQAELQYGYCSPDFQKRFTAQQTPVGNIELIVLTEYAAFDWHITWLTEINTRQALTLVIVDDYLDPRLEQINATHRQAKRPWLLLKVTGEQILAGPLFHPEIDQAPCWKCLSERMYRNQPARMWVSRLEQCSPCVLPVKIDVDAVNKSLALLQRPMTELIDKEETGKLLKLNESTSLFETHTVSKRPQCSCCGDTDLIRRQIETPIKLQANKRLYSFDGGYRTEAPETTLNRLSTYISPITGAIASLQPLQRESMPTIEPSAPIQIYQSVFFKSPYHLDSITADPFVQFCLGKGIDAAQSQASALCEAFERYAAQYQGDEPTIHAIPARLKYPAILPHQLAPFSEAQYQVFAQLSATELEEQHGVKSFSEDTPLPWTQAWSLTHQQARYLPTTYCFANTPFDEVNYCRWGSNGCAAGNSLEEAVLQGLFELVERDAVAIWWYNKITRPGVDLDILPAQHKQRLDSTLGPEWHYWVLDITHDLGIPIMVAVGQHKQTDKFSLGFGCHLEPLIAVERALTELCQLIPIRDEGHKIFNFDDIQAESYLFPEPGPATKPGINRDDIPTQDIKQALEYCLRQTETCGLETIVLNYSRPDIPLYTVNVVIPGLCHIWPQMGCERLYVVPVKMEWREQPLHESDMNTLKLFI